MKRYNVTGMSCAACQARVEKAVSRLPGVVSCSVNLLTGSMGVEGTAADAEIINAVRDAGYGASVQGSDTGHSAADTLTDRDTPVLKKRLFVSLGFLLVLMYVSMGHNMLKLPLPELFERDPVADAVVQLLLCAAVMIINGKFFVSGFKGLLHGAPNMDTLVALGSSASFIWSVYALIMMSDALMTGASTAAPWLGQLYFDSAAMILVLITVGKLLEARSRGKTTDALKTLMSLTPLTATVIRDGTEMTVPVSEVKKGDIFAVRPGESIPVDGLVTEGEASVDESALTGESVPSDKLPGDTVCAATINRSGYIRCEATRVGEDTAIAQIIKTVSDTAASKAPVQSIADKVSGVFVPTVVGIAAVTLIAWLISGSSFEYALGRAISVLVISCPCALGLATPVAVTVGSGVGARHGILFKTAASLEQTGKVSIVALDKTGTVTKGEPEVTELIPCENVTGEELLSAAYALENRSEHPFARAIVKKAAECGAALREVSDFRVLTGNGITAALDGEGLCGGSYKFISGITDEAESVRTIAEALSDKGETPLLFAKSGRLLGVIAVADAVKDEAEAAVAELKEMGIAVVMLTGDNIRTARAAGRRAGIDNVVAGVLPGGKAEVIRRLSTVGSVAMVGDGINDAPALTAADTGIAIAAGTDVAVDAADVVLVNSRLNDVPAAIRLSRFTLKNIRQNLFWAFFYNALCIPLASGVYAGVLGWVLDPMISAAAMSLSSFCVVSNALRLNLFRTDQSRHGKKASSVLADDAVSLIIEEINTKTEGMPMTKTMKIDGMMCPHCEARVKKALEALDGVDCAVPSHTLNNAVVTLSAEVADDVLRSAVEAQGYDVTGIE